MKLALVGFLLTFVGLGVYVWYGEQQNRQSETDFASEEILLTMTNRLAGNEDYLNMLARMRVRGEVTPQSFEERVKYYLQSHPELINFTWVDKDFYIKGVAPLVGNEQIVGLHLDLPEPARVSALARSTRMAQYTSAFEALQGDCSFEVWMPVFDAEEFLGLYAGVYSCRRLLERVVPSSIIERFAITIVSNSGSNLAELRDVSRPLSSTFRLKEFNLNNNMNLSLVRYQEGLWEVNLIVLLASTLALGGMLVVGVLGMQREIVRRRAVQAELERVNEELKQFSYRTSHDMTGPLVTIRGLMSYARKDIDSGDLEEAKSSCIKVEEQALRLQNLVADILNLARADLEDTEQEEVDFAQIIEAVKKTWRRQIEMNGVRIVEDVQLLHGYIGDKVRLQQILENLISNGIKYCNPNRDEPYVDVSVVERDRQVFITVEDNGLGIPADYHNRVFGMFKRFHPKTAFGSGLGLYLIQKHVTHMQGTVDFSSSNHGTRFTVVLPSNHE